QGCPIEPLDALHRAYQIDRQLGSGGFGRVFLAIRRSDGTRVAIKFILKAKMSVHSAERVTEFRWSFCCCTSDFCRNSRPGISLKQLIETLLACHEAGVLHRDIKDENLLVDLADNRLQLIDFAAPRHSEGGAVQPIFD
uniref:Serine/threonine-protein kinase 1 n=1 Tax=Macrostomum lignano TaxID=282301 RepID=A0A1I8FNS1_9PLAT